MNRFFDCGTDGIINVDHVKRFKAFDKDKPEVFCGFNTPTLVIWFEGGTTVRCERSTIEEVKSLETDLYLRGQK